MYGLNVDPSLKKMLYHLKEEFVNIRSVDDQQQAYNFNSTEMNGITSIINKELSDIDDTPILIEALPDDATEMIDRGKEILDKLFSQVYRNDMIRLKWQFLIHLVDLLYKETYDEVKMLDFELWLKRYKNVLISISTCIYWYVHIMKYTIEWIDMNIKGDNGFNSIYWVTYVPEMKQYIDDNSQVSTSTQNERPIVNAMEYAKFLEEIMMKNKSFRRCTKRLEDLYETDIVSNRVGDFNTQLSTFIEKRNEYTQQIEQYYVENYLHSSDITDVQTASTNIFSNYNFQRRWEHITELTPTPISVAIDSIMNDEWYIFQEKYEKDFKEYIDTTKKIEEELRFHQHTNLRDILRRFCESRSKIILYLDGKDVFYKNAYDAESIRSAIHSVVNDAYAMNEKAVKDIEKAKNRLGEAIYQRLQKKGILKMITEEKPMKDIIISEPSSPPIIECLLCRKPIRYLDH